MSFPLPTEVRIRRKADGDFAPTGQVTDAPSADGKVAVYWGRQDRQAYVTVEEVDGLDWAIPLSILATDVPPEVRSNSQLPE
jgi:hypothetical protein